MYRLCYVEPPWAWFTTCRLDQQWGDDWDDAPYEHNSGRPYEFYQYMESRGVERYDLVKVAYDSAWFQTPAQKAGNNSAYSVKTINNLETPWLTYTKWPDGGDVNIWAGISVEEFIKTISEHGGAVFSRIEYECK